MSTGAAITIPREPEYAEAVRIQNELAPRLILKGGPRKVRTVAGADISYSRGSDRFFCVIVLLRAETMETIEEARFEGKARFPYIPGLLSFRETPFILEAFKKLHERPDVMLFDGHGVAHPRGFGLACHAGLLLDLPSVGCAKSVLVGEYDEPGMERGAQSALRYKRKRVGYAVRTRSRVNPVFISPGHRIGMAPAVRLALSFSRGYRIPEPTRLAHLAVNRYRAEREN